MNIKDEIAADCEALCTMFETGNADMTDEERRRMEPQLNPSGDGFYSKLPAMYDESSPDDDHDDDNSCSDDSNGVPLLSHDCYSPNEKEDEFGRIIEHRRYLHGADRHAAALAATRIQAWVRGAWVRRGGVFLPSDHRLNFSSQEAIMGPGEAGLVLPAMGTQTGCLRRDQKRETITCKQLLPLKNNHVCCPRVDATASASIINKSRIETVDAVKRATAVEPPQEPIISAKEAPKKDVCDQRAVDNQHAGFQTEVSTKNRPEMMLLISGSPVPEDVVDSYEKSSEKVEMSQLPAEVQQAAAAEEEGLEAALSPGPPGWLKTPSPVRGSQTPPPGWLKTPSPVRGSQTPPPEEWLKTPSPVNVSFGTTEPSPSSGTNNNISTHSGRLTPLQKSHSNDNDDNRFFPKGEPQIGPATVNMDTKTMMKKGLINIQEEEDNNVNRAVFVEKKSSSISAQQQTVSEKKAIVLPKIELSPLSALLMKKQFCKDGKEETAEDRLKKTKLLQIQNELTELSRICERTLNSEKKPAAEKVRLLQNAQNHLIRVSPFYLRSELLPFFLHQEDVYLLEEEIVATQKKLQHLLNEFSPTLVSSVKEEAELFVEKTKKLCETLVGKIERKLETMKDEVAVLTDDELAQFADPQDLADAYHQFLKHAEELKSGSSSSNEGEGGGLETLKCEFGRATAFGRSINVSSVTLQSNLLDPKASCAEYMETFDRNAGQELTKIASSVLAVGEYYRKVFENFSNELQILEAKCAHRGRRAEIAVVERIFENKLMASAEQVLYSEYKTMTILESCSGEKNSAKIDNIKDPYSKNNTKKTDVVDNRSLALCEKANLEPTSSKDNLEQQASSLPSNSSKHSSNISDAFLENMLIQMLTILDSLKNEKNSIIQQKKTFNIHANTFQICTTLSKQSERVENCVYKLFRELRRRDFWETQRPILEIALSMQREIRLYIKKHEQWNIPESDMETLALDHLFKLAVLLEGVEVLTYDFAKNFLKPKFRGVLEPDVFEKTFLKLWRRAVVSAEQRRTLEKLEQIHKFPNSHAAKEFRQRIRKNAEQLQSHRQNICEKKKDGDETVTPNNVFLHTDFELLENKISENDSKLHTIGSREFSLFFANCYYQILVDQCPARAVGLTEEEKKESSAVLAQPDGEYVLYSADEVVKVFGIDETAPHCDENLAKNGAPVIKIPTILARQTSNLLSFRYSLAHLPKQTAWVECFCDENLGHDRMQAAPYSNLYQVITPMLPLTSNLALKAHTILRTLKLGDRLFALDLPQWVRDENGATEFLRMRVRCIDRGTEGAVTIRGADDRDGVRHVRSLNVGHANLKHAKLIKVERIVVPSDNNNPCSKRGPERTTVCRGPGETATNFSNSVLERRFVTVGDKKISSSYLGLSSSAATRISSSPSSSSSSSSSSPTKADPTKAATSLRQGATAEGATPTFNINTTKSSKKISNRHEEETNNDINHSANERMMIIPHDEIKLAAREIPRILRKKVLTVLEQEQFLKKLITELERLVADAPLTLEEEGSSSEKDEFEFSSEKQMDTDVVEDEYPSNNSTSTFIDDNNEFKKNSQNYEVKDYRVAIDKRPSTFFPAAAAGPKNNSLNADEKGVQLATLDDVPELSNESTLVDEDREEHTPSHDSLGSYSGVVGPGLQRIVEQRFARIEEVYEAVKRGFRTVTMELNNIAQDLVVFPLPAELLSCDYVNNNNDLSTQLAFVVDDSLEDDFPDQRSAMDQNARIDATAVLSPPIVAISPKNEKGGKSGSDLAEKEPLKKAPSVSIEETSSIFVADNQNAFSTTRVAIIAEKSIAIDKDATKNANDVENRLKELLKKTTPFQKLRFEILQLQKRLSRCATFSDFALRKRDVHRLLAKKLGEKRKLNELQELMTNVEKCQKDVAEYQRRAGECREQLRTTSEKFEKLHAQFCANTPTLPISEASGSSEVIDIVLTEQSNCKNAEPGCCDKVDEDTMLLRDNNYTEVLYAALNDFRKARKDCDGLVADFEKNLGCPKNSPIQKLLSSSHYSSNNSTSYNNSIARTDLSQNGGRKTVGMFPGAQYNYVHPGPTTNNNNQAPPCVNQQNHTPADIVQPLRRAFAELHRDIFLLIQKNGGGAVNMRDSGSLHNVGPQMITRQEQLLYNDNNYKIADVVLKLRIALSLHLQKVISSPNATFRAMLEMEYPEIGKLLLVEKRRAADNNIIPEELLSELTISREVFVKYCKENLFLPSFFLGESPALLEIYDCVMCKTTPESRVLLNDEIITSRSNSSNSSGGPIDNNNTNHDVVVDNNTARPVAVERKSDPAESPGDRMRCFDFCNHVFRLIFRCNRATVLTDKMEISKGVERFEKRARVEKGDFVALKGDVHVTKSGLLRFAAEVIMSHKEEEEDHGSSSMKNNCEGAGSKRSRVKDDDFTNKGPGGETKSKSSRDNKLDLKEEDIMAEKTGSKEEDTKSSGFITWVGCTGNNFLTGPVPVIYSVIQSTVLTENLEFTSSCAGVPICIKRRLEVGSRVHALSLPQPMKPGSKIFRLRAKIVIEDNAEVFHLEKSREKMAEGLTTPQDAVTGWVTLESGETQYLAQHDPAQSEPDFGFQDGTMIMTA